VFCVKRKISFFNLDQRLGGRKSFELLLLTSSAAILFGFGCRLTNIKSQHSSKPDALAVIL